MKHRSILLTLGLLAITPTAANAAQVQKISATEATDGPYPTINVCPTTGYNLSFLKAKGGIVHAQVVDPSRVHVSFDSGKVGTGSPGKVVFLRRINPLKFPGMPVADEKQYTTLTVITSAQQRYIFKVAFGCPSQVIAGDIIPANRPRRRTGFLRPSDRDSGSKPKSSTKVSSTTRTTPAKARPLQASREAKSQRFSNLSFDRQLIVNGDTSNLYGLGSESEHAPPSEVSELADPEGLVPEPPLEESYARAEPPTVQVTKKSQVTPAEVSPSKIAWHLTRGLHRAKNQGEIGYQSQVYRNIQTVIIKVRRGASLESAIASSAPYGQLEKYQKIGANLLKYGGLD